MLRLNQPTYLSAPLLTSHTNKYQDIQQTLTLGALYQNNVCLLDNLNVPLKVWSLLIWLIWQFSVMQVYTSESSYNSACLPLPTMAWFLIALIYRVLNGDSPVWFLTVVSLELTHRLIFVHYRNICCIEIVRWFDFAPSWMNIQWRWLYPMITWHGHKF